MAIFVVFETVLTKSPMQYVISPSLVERVTRQPNDAACVLMRMLVASAWIPIAALIIIFIVRNVSVISLTGLIKSRGTTRAKKLIGCNVIVLARFNSTNISALSCVSCAPNYNNHKRVSWRVNMTLIYPLSSNVESYKTQISNEMVHTVF